MAALIAHLLGLFYGNHLDRHLLLAFYRWQQPGMPAAWYGPYVRFLIIHHPHVMRGCLTALQHHRPYRSLGRVCP